MAQVIKILVKRKHCGIFYIIENYSYQIESRTTAVIFF